jgi:hypothetical protein
MKVAVCILVVSTGLFAASVGFATSAQAAPAGASSGVIPPQAMPHGATYGQWDAGWWQWLYQTPMSQSPEFAGAGSQATAQPVDCSAGQSGHVWFLGGTYLPTSYDSSSNPPVSKSDVYRSCTIPTGTSLFFPIINGEADNLSCPAAGGDPNNNGNTDLSAEQLAGYASEFSNYIVPGSMSATIDGASVSGLANGNSIYRAPSPWFSYTLPADNTGTLFGCDFPAGTTPPTVDGHLGATADGIYLMLAPLSPGVHQIHFGGESDIPAGQPSGPLQFIQNINYTITVG